MRPHPRRARTNPNSPRAWGTSDRNGMINNHQNLVWQWDWAGQTMINKRILVNPDELDKPQRQLGTIVLSPDPLPVMNARVEPYAIDELWSVMMEGSNEHGSIPVYLESSSQPSDNAQITISLELSTIDAD